MINPADFARALTDLSIRFFTGVPDSLLQSLCAYIDDNTDTGCHVIAANEGNALALAAGHYLGTQQPACVYLQNSGLGNLVNPITSLTDAEVYRIPALLIIGWRGEPGVKDEPQHIKQGRITPQLLTLLDIPYLLLHADSDFRDVLRQANDLMRQRHTPVALLVQKDTFSLYRAQKTARVMGSLSRESALEALVKLSGDNVAIVATTGKTSRELYEIRARAGQPQRDFLTVGAMGHASSIALGLALAHPSKQVMCLDGDGALLMHLGAMAVIAQSQAENVLHVVLNNASHESVGGQQTAAATVKLQDIAQGMGYRQYYRVNQLDNLTQVWQHCRDKPGPTLLEIRIASGSRADLARPSTTPEQNKIAFMAYINHADL